MPYRDDEQALQAKREQLEHDRVRIEERKRALANLTEDEARVNRELADIERRLAKRKRSLPVLGEVRIASPCSADWNAMKGDDQARFCSQCNKNVYNLSAMTTQQAESLIRAKEGDVCVRYYERADGTVMTADCPVGVRKKRVKKAVFVAAFGAAAGAAVMQVREKPAVMGGMAMPAHTPVLEARMGKYEAFDLDEDADNVSRPVIKEIPQSPPKKEVGRGTMDDPTWFAQRSRKLTTPPALPDHPIEYRNGAKNTNESFE